MPLTNNFLLLRIKKNGELQVVERDNNCPSTSRITQQYLYDSPEGEQYYVLNPYGELVARYRVEFAKTLERLAI